MLLTLIHIINILVPVVVSVPTVYDQRQSGNSNVRIDVRDAVLIAIADEMGDYDYTYDYSDLTVKPEEPSPPPTTSKPTTPSPKPIESSSSPAPKPVESTSLSPKPMTAESSPPETSPAVQNASIIIDNSTLTFVTKPGNDTTEEVAPVNTRPSPPHFNQDYQIPVIVLHEAKENTKLLPVKIVEKSASAVRANLTEGFPQPRHCSPGFFLDSHNRCKRIRKPLREIPQLRQTRKQRVN